MTKVYLISAAVGGTLIVCQFLMGMLGIGHHDVEHEAPHFESDHAHGGDHSSDASWLVGVLTFRTLVAALTFFGLGGLAAGSGGAAAVVTFGVAVVCGLAALLIVAGVMRGMTKLKSDGTVRIEGAVGKSGTVYLKIPGNKAGFGKVTLNLQNRTAEYAAVTFADDLPTGTKVVVVDIVPPDTLEVVAEPATGRNLA